MISRIGSPTLGLIGLAFGPRLLADSSGAGFGVFCCGLFCCLAVLIIIPIVGLYKVFEKAGQPGWHALVPYLNGCVVAHIVGREWWWGIVPGLNIVAYFELAKAFGKDTGYGVGLILLNPVFLLMLGFGDAQYVLPPKAPLF